MAVFNLPDLGEGLADAEIAAWHVAVDEEVARDQPLVSVATAKAVVDIPSPYAGKIVKLGGAVGDIVETGRLLVEFETADGSAAGPAPESADKGTVVGAVAVGNDVVEETAISVGKRGAGVKATPAVRALARRANVDVSHVTPSGKDGTITAADVRRVAGILNELGPMESLRGVRRVMAQTMALAHADVVPVTLVEDADIEAWSEFDVTIRLVRAIVAGCRTEPALNAWYDGHAIGRRVLKKIDLGVALDTEDGLFVPVLRDVGNRAPDDLRQGLEAMRRAVEARDIPPEELRGQTITLSNFGMLGGRYANPVVVPPQVAILGAGRARAEPVIVNGEVAARHRLPLSLTFDHRAVTGGEATRFLMAAIEDLQKPE
ncbi:MAG: 2-oxo acid dehydrogenase subunit E2 [Gammaproteobacteria bacterium]|nr:2-oxo acid dehydrogenase subunit E2 [Gammaproteobacteria bacterium]